jgi:hypothetical protein
MSKSNVIQVKKKETDPNTTIYQVASVLIYLSLQT